MEPFIPLLAVLIIVSLVIWAVEKMPPPLGGPAKPWIEIVVVLAAAAYLAKAYLHL